MSDYIEFIVLEKFQENDIDQTRAIIFERDTESGYTSVKDILQSDDENLLWEAIEDKHDLTKMHAVNADGEPEMPDCLTIREAAEASVRDYR